MGNTPSSHASAPNLSRDLPAVKPIRGGSHQLQWSWKFTQRATLCQAPPSQDPDDGMAPPARSPKERSAGHFMCKGLRDGELFLRRPGEVDGQQIAVEGCVGASIVLCDHLDSVLLDNCSDCRLYIGPTSGSVFIRSSKGCKIIAAANQFRAKDCIACDVLLLCPSRPVLECSSAMRFGPFVGSYALLSSHLADAQLSMFVNRWHDIHDFTPPEGSPDAIAVQRSILPTEGSPRLSGLPGSPARARRAAPSLSASAGNRALANWSILVSTYACPTDFLGIDLEAIAPDLFRDCENIVPIAPAPWPDAADHVTAILFLMQPLIGAAFGIAARLQLGLSACPLSSLEIGGGRCTPQSPEAPLHGTPPRFPEDDAATLSTLAASAASIRREMAATAQLNAKDDPSLSCQADSGGSVRLMFVKELLLNRDDIADMAAMWPTRLREREKVKLLAGPCVIFAVGGPAGSEWLGNEMKGLGSAALLVTGRAAGLLTTYFAFCRKDSQYQ